MANGTVARLLLGALLGAFEPRFAAAQVVLDGTLGEAGPVRGPQYDITADLGQKVGGNLFHSFDRFNIGAGETATFSGPSSVDRVIGRVTGGNASLIDGRIASTIPGADLFLVNPHGMIFGPGSSIDVQGSFHASSADYVRLGEDGRFDARAPQDSVLTTAPPSAFGFLTDRPAPIQVSGSILKVPEGKELSLVGGDLTVSDGALDASSGGIDLVSMAGPGEVDVGTASAAPTARLGDIHLSASALFTGDSLTGPSPGGAGSGTVRIRGGQLVSDGSVIGGPGAGPKAGGVDIRLTNDFIMTDGAISTISEGPGAAGFISIEARRITMAGSANILASALADGAAGHIKVRAREGMTVGTPGTLDYATIEAVTEGDGPAGTIDIASGGAVSLYYADVIASSFDSGPAGTILFDADRLNLAEGSQLLATGVGGTGEPVGSGFLDRAGHIRINGRSGVTIAGISSDGFAPGIFVTSRGESAGGPGGTVTVTTPDLRVEDGGRIDAQSRNLTDGGIVDLDVGSLSLSGGGFISAAAYDKGAGGKIDIAASGAISVSYSDVLAATFGPGSAGTITIDADRLDIAEGGAIRAGAYGTDFTEAGAPGQVTIRGGSGVDIRGVSPDGFISGIYVDTSGEASAGDGGHIEISTPKLWIDDLGQINAATVNQRDAGVIDLKVGDLLMTDLGRASVTNEGDGAGGAIRVTADGLVALQGGDLLASTFGPAAAGTITIDTDRLEIADGSQILGEAVGDVAEAGPAGHVEVIARGGIDIHGASADGELKSGIFVSSRELSLGQSGGSITVTTPDLRIADFGRIEAKTLNQSRGGDIDLTVNTLSLTNGGVVTAATGDTGPAGEIRIHAADGIFVSDKGNDVIARSGGNPIDFDTDPAGIIAQSRPEGDNPSGDAGRIEISTGTLTMVDGGQINNLSLLGGRTGAIDIVADRVSMDSGASISAQTVAAGSEKGGGINIEAKEGITITGGIPLNNGDVSHSKISTGTASNAPAGDIRITAPSLVMNGGAISTGTSGVGRAGAITMNIRDLLELSGQAQIFSGTDGVGAGNGLMVNAGRVRITGEGLDLTAAPTGLFTNVNPGGTGKGGDIFVSARDITLSNAGAITTESQGTGSAGNVALAVSGALTLNFGIISTNVAVLNPATSTATTETSGGNIAIGADEVLMNNASAILTANDGPGRGGDIAIGTRHFFANGSSVSTTAQRGDGGNMRLTVGYLFDIVDTNILSSVRTGVGNGGNIIIDPPFMVLDGSRIEANAFGGDGGNILIQAGQLISSPDSVIQASSELGIDGNIDIAAPETDVGGAIAILPGAFLDNANLLADTCAARGGKPGSSLMAGGRGGLPPDPGEPLSFDFGASVPLGTPDENSTETGGTVPTGVLMAASSFVHTECSR